MQYNKTRKLMIIDGRNCGGFLYDIPTGEYEWFMYDRGYTAIPKDDIISVSRQDLVEHPDKFRPYTYSKSSGFSISYEDMAEKGFKHLRYSDGRDIIVCNADDHTSFKNEDELVQDLVYMRENYRNLYDKLVTTSDIPEIFSKVDECMANKQGQSPANHNSAPQRQSSGGKTRYTTALTITPDQVNVDELPERITYIKKKVGDGFVFVPEDKPASKSTPKSKSGNKNKPVDAAAVNVANIYNAMQAFSGQQQADQTPAKPNYNPVAEMISVTGGSGQAHVVNKPMPNFMAEDIDLNDTFIRIDVNKDIAGVIMKPDGTKYIVANNPVQPAQPIPQMAAVPAMPMAATPAPATAQAQVAPQTPAPATPEHVEAFDPASDPQLKSVIEKLQGAGTFNVKLNTECGVTKVLVEDANGKLMNNLCFTVDLVGVCQTPDRKMWFGLPEIPDFSPSYAFNDAAINMIFTGEGEENLSPIFNGETCKLNRLVDLHSIFNIPGLNAETILEMMKTIKGIVNKRSVKIELEEKENMNVRFTIGDFKDPKNFRLILQNRTYLYNGGPLSNNKNKSFYIGVQNNQMKFYTGKKSKQQHTPITPEQEETNKRITAILNEQIALKPSDIVNSIPEESDVIIEDLEPMPEAATA